MKRKIAILWHMHQPYYRNPHSGKMELPWVRLHGLKDYYGMVAILKDFPAVKAVYNLVPSLLVQLESYLQGDKDIFQELFLKDAAGLTGDEVRFLVRHFFSANYANLIKPYPRFRYLLDKKKRYAPTALNAGDWLNIYSVNELRDLQVWYPLCHFDEIYKAEDHRITGLIQKGGNFSEADKRILVEAEMELLSKIIPEYKRFAQSGQIEISTTPFYHPIMPLLIDPQAGRTANPGLPEYDLHFNWKEDAVYQMEQALTYMKDIFGTVPSGVWPSEGSLSREVLNMLDDLGVRWTATDETNLCKSLSTEIRRDHDYIVQNPEVLYKPYVLAAHGDRKRGNTRIFFRDTHLSDLIGFHYRKMPFDKAAADLVDRLKKIPARSDMVVPIILDGENAWEYFSNSGRDFLSEFFRLISADNELETVTFSEALDMEAGEIRHYSPGSWIGGNFDIWIGDEEDRKGWRLLEKVRKTIEERKSHLTEKQYAQIREYLSIAQGSDWFWWFGKENYTADLDIFDNLFRKNMQKIYEILGMDIPVEFLVPISTVSAGGGGIEIHPPTGIVHPVINGRLGAYFEWLHAGRLEAAALGGAMNITNPLANTIYYGFGKEHLYLRVDTEKKVLTYFQEDYTLDVIFKRKRKRIVIPVTAEGNKADKRTVTECGVTVETAVDRVIEIAVPLADLDLLPGDPFCLQLEWKRFGRHFQSIPAYDYFHLHLPTSKDYLSYWQV